MSGGTLSHQNRRGGTSTSGWYGAFDSTVAVCRTWCGGSADKGWRGVTGSSSSSVPSYTEQKDTASDAKRFRPEFHLAMRSFNPAAAGSEGSRRETEDRGGPHKTVTMASTSRYLTDRQYVTRKPLFSAEQQSSILKKTHTLQSTEKEKSLGIRRREHPAMTFLTGPKEEQVTEGVGFSPSVIPPPTAWRKALDSAMTISELREQLCFSDPTPPSPATSSAVQALSSSDPKVNDSDAPQKPRPAPSVLSPTNTPPSGHCGVQTRLRLEETQARGGGHNNQCFSSGSLKGGKKSTYQENYWACVIPKASPPSPDRRSTAWDPNKEYQDLLDYTYPLRPGQGVREWDMFENQEGPLDHTDSNLQDSGIGLDHLDSSTNLPALELFPSSSGHMRERRHSPIADETIPTLQAPPSRPSGGRPSNTSCSLTGPVDLSLDSLGCSKDTSGTNHFHSDGYQNLQQALSALTSMTSSGSTFVLPPSRWEVDEEFRPLPEHLEGMQLLSRQVREVTAKVSQPVIGSWDSLLLDTASIVSSVTGLDKQGADDGGAEAEVEQARDDKPDKYRGNKTRKDQSPPVNAGGVRRTGSSVWEVEALGEWLCGLSLPDKQRSSLKEQEYSDSLIQHIQVFCSHLKLLIQQLHALSERVNLLTAPAVDMDSVKASLAEYQSLQREVSSHRPLTTCVLHTGQLLLSCINTTSPLLRDSLLLIERQSAVLHSYTEHFLSSILATMETLNQPGFIRYSTEEGAPL